MRVPYYQHRVLRRVERGLCRSDPHLAAMLAIFARLTAGEVITSREQSGLGRNWMRRSLAWLWTMMAGLAACSRWVFGRVSRACVAVQRRFSGDVRTARSG